MRISDWSSDVCSSDLLYDRPCRWAGGKGRRLFDLPRSAGVRRAGPERAPPRLPAAWHRRIGGRRVARAGLGHGRCDRARLQRDKTWVHRSEEHTSELQSLMRISYAVFCLKKNKNSQERRSLLITQETNQAT